MTLTTTTQAELLATLKAMNNGQQSIIQQGYNAYSKRQLCFWAKWPATKADVQALIPEYVTEIAPGQYKLTEAGIQLYRAWLNQPLARPNADQQPQGYHGTRQSRNWQLRERWEEKLSSTPLAKAAPAEVTQPEAVATSAAPLTAPVVETEPVDEPAEVTPPTPPTPPQPPAPPVPGVIQLDLTAFMQPLIAEIETLKAQLAAQPQAPRPVARRPRPSMPLQIVSRRGGAA